MSDMGKEDVPHAFRVGVVVERRESANPWIDAAWKTVGVLPEFSAEGAFKLLSEGPGWQRYLAGGLVIELFKRETEAYKMNFSQDQPAVYVVLRPGQETGERDVEPFLATLSPYEAESYNASGELFVDAIAMPPVIAAWAASFIEMYHVDQPFMKRKQKRKDANAFDRQGPRHQGNNHEE